MAGYLILLCDGKLSEIFPVSLYNPPPVDDELTVLSSCTWWDVAGIVNTVFFRSERKHYGFQMWHRGTAERW